MKYARGPNVPPPPNTGTNLTTWNACVAKIARDEAETPTESWKSTPQVRQLDAELEAVGYYLDHPPRGHHLFSREGALLGWVHRVDHPTESIYRASVRSWTGPKEKPTLHPTREEAKQWVEHRA